MCITSGEGSRDAAQATTSSTKSAPDWYVASSIRWWATGWAWYCAKVSAASSGWDCRAANSNSVCWDMAKESIKELYKSKTMESGANSYEIRTNFERISQSREFVNVVCICV